MNLCTDAPEKERKIFYASVLESKSVQHKENYFVESSNKIHYFYEAGALNASGDLLVDPSIALNKVRKEIKILEVLVLILFPFILSMFLGWSCVAYTSSNI